MNGEQGHGEEAEEDEQPDFPPELDEFLEYCVAEREGDFEAISSDFLDIAAELEEPLAERAQEFFSPEALRQRWQFLSGESAEAPPPPPAENACVATRADVTPPTRGSGEPAGDAQELSAPPRSQGQPIEIGAEAEAETAVSGFSVFKDSLKEQIDKIYSQVQSNLPCAVGGDDDEDSEEDPGPAHLQGASSAVPSVAQDATHLQRQDHLAGSAAALFPACSGTGAGTGAGAGAGAGARLSEQALRQRAAELFGTDDLSQIFSGAAKGPAVSCEVPNFDVVLLSHGVNPQDIEGPLVQPPKLFQRVCTLPDEDAQQEHELAQDLTAVPAQAATTAQTAANQQESRHQPLAGKGSGLSAKPSGPAPAGAPSKGPRSAPPATRAETGSEGSAPSDDSADEDFAAMRRSAKSSSLGIVGTQDGGSSGSGSGPGPGPMRVVAHQAAGSEPKPQGQPQRAAQAAKPGQPVPAAKSGHVPSRPKQRFVKLELAESSEEDASEAASSSSEAAEGVDSEEEREMEPVRVVTRLLQKAPTGDCPWDVWLDARRRCPRLQVAAGTPEFRHSGEELRVSFSVERLHAFCQEQQQLCEERRRKQGEAEERMRTGVEELIREAERRREMVNGHFRGGFVLNSPVQLQMQMQGGADRRQTGAKKDQVASEVEAEDEAPKPEDAKAEAEAEGKAEAEVGRPRQEEGKRPIFRRPQPRPEVEAERARHREAREEARRQQEQVKAQEGRERQEQEARRSQLIEVAEIARARQLPLFDQQVTAGPPLSGLSPHAQTLLRDSPSNPATCAIYGLPWGVPDGGSTAPTAEQREALAVLHALCLAEAMVLVAVQVIVAAGVPNPARGYATLVLLLFAGTRGSTIAGETQLQTGKSLLDVLVGPLPLPPLVALLQRPLALWALELNQPTAAAERAAHTVAVESLCVVLCTRAGAEGEAILPSVLKEVEQEGLEVVGLRLAYPDPASARAVHSAAMRSAIRAGQPALLLCLRGPYALGVWRSLLGPADPVLARATDPSSLNARFGGCSRSEAVALAPPSSSSRALADLAWAFGGRIDPERPEPPREPLHAATVALPQVFAVRIDGPLSFAGTGVLLSGLLLRLGRTLSLSTCEGGLLATAVRDGGGAFIQGCERLLSAPPRDLVDSASVAVGSPVKAHQPGLAAEGMLEGCRTELCPLPRQQGLVLNTSALAASSPSLQEACRLGEPEILIIGLRPRSSLPTPLLVQGTCEGLYAKFGPAGAPQLSFGSGVELLAVRALDFAALRAHLQATAAVAGQLEREGPGQVHEQQQAAILEGGLEVLREFHSFAHVVNQASSEVTEGWWEPGEGGGPTVMLCLQGEGLIVRFRHFLAKEWKFTAATAGDVLFAPRINVARRAFHTFFETGTGSPGPSPFLPAFQQADMRSAHRFRAHAHVPAGSGAGSVSSPASSSLSVSEAALFPLRLAPQLTAAVLLPPSVDAVLFRLLTAADQHDSDLAAAVIAGGLSEETAELIFMQELEDGHLFQGDREAFLESVGRGPNAEKEEGLFRSVCLVLSRHQGVKWLAHLCGHGDPAVNRRSSFASLRTGHDRVQNGLRCPTSSAKAQGLLTSLGPVLPPLLAPTGEPGERRLGLEACARVLECSLCAAAVAKVADLSLARLLRESHTALTERGLSVVGLRALSPQTPGLDEQWPGLTNGCLALLGRWQETRPAAARLLGLVTAGAPFLVIACEGPLAAERARAALVKVGTQVGKEALESYASAGASEGAADVAQLFSELFGGQHYVVDASA